MGYAVTIDDITPLQNLPYEINKDKTQTDLLSLFNRDVDRDFKNINKLLNTNIIDYLKSLPIDFYKDSDVTLGTNDAIKIIDFVDHAQKENDAIDKLALERIELLARKYVRESMSKEEKARLDIINDRLDNLLPLVTESEIIKIEETSQMINTLSERLGKRLKKLKL